MSWQSSTLGDLLKKEGGFIQTGPFGSQLHQSDYVDEGIPVIMPKDISNGKVNSDSVARVSEETANRLSRHQLQPKTIVLPRRGEVTKRAFITQEQIGWLCGTGCLQIVLQGKALIPEFLYYFMEQEQSVRWLEQNAVGTTMLNLSGAIVAKFPIKYPSISVQKCIVETLSTYDNLIENNHRRMNLMEDYARHIHREWFVRLRFPGYNKTKINRYVLKNLCDDIRDSVLPENIETETPYIGLEHIPRRSITLCNWGTTEEVTSTKLRFKEGDVIFGKIRPYFHKVGFALVDGVSSSDSIVMRPVKDDFRCLVLLTTSSDEFVAHTSQTMREGSKMPRADWKIMREYPVLLPPDSLLRTFNTQIEPILQQLKNLAFQNRKLQAARDLLLPRLMSGEIPV